MDKDYKFMKPDEVVEELLTLPIGESIDFTFDTPDDVTDDTFEPTGWYGIKRMKLFDEPFGVLCFGYYGGTETMIEHIYELEEIYEDFQNYLHLVADSVEWLCVSTKHNGE